MSSSANQTAESAGSGDARGRDPKVVATRAKSYFLEAWFPANPVTVREARKLASADGDDPTALLELLKADPALFSHLFRNAAAGHADPFVTLKNWSKKDLARDLPISPSKISPHNLQQASDTQALQIQSMLISTTIAEALAKAYNQDPREIWLLQLLRLMGFGLTAWNYPRIYNRVMQKLQVETGTLDRSLAKILGYSPTLVMVSILKDWGVSEEKCRLVAAPYMPPGVKLGPEETSESLNPEQQAVLEICWVGETFARRYDSEHFSVKPETVHWATERVVKQLGKNALSKLEEEINRRWQFYTSAQVNHFPENFSLAARRSPISNGYGRKRYDSNSFVRLCPQPVQDKFLEVYEHIHQGAPSSEGLQVLVGDLIPFAGYVSGCIYLVKDSNLKLKPTIYIGLAREGDFVPVYNSSSVMITDPLLKAYMSGLPVKGRALKKNESQVTYFASSLGTGERRAILYLEIEDDVAKEKGLNPFDCFRAIILCLADALNIECNLSINDLNSAAISVVE